MTNQQHQIEMVLTALKLDRQIIARRLRVDRTTVSRTLSGERESEQTLNSIADVIREDFKALVKDKPHPAST